MRIHLAAALAVSLWALLVGCGQAARSIGRGAAYSSSGSGSGSGEDLRDTLAVMVLLTDTNFKGGGELMGSRRWAAKAQGWARHTRHTTARAPCCTAPPHTHICIHTRHK